MSRYDEISLITSTEEGASAFVIAVVIVGITFVIIFILGV